MVQATTGCGSRGQRFIDKAHQSLKHFVNQHLEYEFLVPAKVVCEDGGLSIPRGGMKTFIHNRLLSTLKLSSAVLK